MKYLSLISTLFWMFQFTASEQMISSSSYSENSPVEVSIDWGNPVNRVHTDSYRLKKLSKRKIIKLYLINRDAQQQFDKQGHVHTEGKTRRVNPERNTLIFNVSSDGIVIKEALYIYVLPNQKLIYTASE